MSRIWLIIIVFVSVYASSYSAFAMSCEAALIRVAAAEFPNSIRLDRETRRIVRTKTSREEVIANYLRPVAEPVYHLKNGEPP